MRGGFVGRELGLRVLGRFVGMELGLRVRGALVGRRLGRTVSGCVCARVGDGFDCCCGIVGRLMGEVGLVLAVGLIAPRLGLGVSGWD